MKPLIVLLGRVLLKLRDGLNVEKTGKPRRTLIVGVGNLLRGDDGLGPTAVKVLENMRMPPWVKVEDLGSALHNLLSDRLKDYGKVIFIDAVKRGANPGTVHRFKPEKGKLGGRMLEETFSLHETGIPEILR
ncbi:MAG: protein HyaD1, partial [Candidatus Hecatellales archaeon B24]